MLYHWANCRRQQVGTMGAERIMNRWFQNLGTILDHEPQQADRNCARLVDGNMPKAVRSPEASMFIEGDVSSMPGKPVYIGGMRVQCYTLTIEEELDLKFVSKVSIFIIRSFHLPSWTTEPS